jgi:hypothetical protein
MIRMFVSNQDAVDALDVLLDRGKPRQRFALSKATVHKESGSLRLEQSNVARAAGRQNGNPQADRSLLVTARKPAGPVPRSATNEFSE